MASHDPAMEVQTTEDSGPASIVPAPISSSYCVPYGSQITVSSWRGGRYTIYESKVQQMFDVGKVSGKLAWLRRLRVLRDPSGRTVAFMKPKILSLRYRWDVYGDEEANDSSFLFMVRTMGCRLFSAPCFAVFLVNNLSKSPDFKVIGKGIFKRKFTILNQGSSIAEAREKAGGYNLTVNPGVDLAFISSVIVIIDQVLESIARNERNANFQHGAVASSRHQSCIV